MGSANVTDIEGIVSRESVRLDADVRSALEAFPVAGRDGGVAATLTVAEQGVLRLVGLGLSNEAIGEALRVSAGTVRTHAKRIHDKCCVEGRARLAVVAREIGARR